MTTPAKIFSFPIPGTVTVRFGLTPDSSTVACTPTSDSGGP